MLDLHILSRCLKLTLLASIGNLLSRKRVIKSPLRLEICRGSWYHWVILHRRLVLSLLLSEKLCSRFSHWLGGILRIISVTTRAIASQLTSCSSVCQSVD